MVTATFMVRLSWWCEWRWRGVQTFAHRFRLEADRSIYLPGLWDGQNPVGGVVVDQAGNLYGTTFDGGDNGGGTVYELSPSDEGWSFTTLYSFTGGYGGPYNKLTLVNGNLYGFTEAEGANGFGSG